MPPQSRKSLLQERGVLNPTQDAGLARPEDFMKSASALAALHYNPAHLNMIDRRDFLKTTVVASMVPAGTAGFADTASAAADAAQANTQAPRLFPGFTARRI